MGTRPEAEEYDFACLTLPLARPRRISDLYIVLPDCPTICHKFADPATLIGRKFLSAQRGVRSASDGDMPLNAIKHQGDRVLGVVRPHSILFSTVDT